MSQKYQGRRPEAVPELSSPSLAQYIANIMILSEAQMMAIM
jgi:hypothetical protein